MSLSPITGMSEARAAQADADLRALRASQWGRKREERRLRREAALRAKQEAERARPSDGACISCGLYHSEATGCLRTLRAHLDVQAALVKALKATVARRNGQLERKAEALKSACATVHAANLAERRLTCDLKRSQDQVAKLSVAIESARSDELKWRQRCEAAEDAAKAERKRADAAEATVAKVRRVVG